MAGDTGDRMKIVIGYAVWATLCAAAAGVAISLIHTWFFSYHGSRPGFWRTLLEDAAAAARHPAGPGARPGSLAARAPVPTRGPAPLLASTRRGPRPRAMVRPARPVVRRRARAAHGGGILP